MSDQEIPHPPAPDGIDFQPVPTIGGKPANVDAEAQEWLAIDQVAPSDEEIEALAKRLPAPPEWFGEG